MANISDWAKREIEIALSDNNTCGWARGVYDSALKAFISLCNDGHSGMSIGATKQVLNRLIDCKPLTPLTGSDDEWGLCSDVGDELMYQNKRCTSVFKKVNKLTGDITYSDVDRFVCEDINNSNIRYYSGRISKEVERYFSLITMPYVPPSKPIVIYTEDFLFDEKNGDFDTQGIFYAIDGDTGSRTDIDIFLAERDGVMESITKEEYIERRKNRIEGSMNISHSAMPSLESVQSQVNRLSDPGKLSDGFHTFDELYYHRMMLFSIICNTHKDVAWKSWKHADGTMYDDMFIVGLSLPNGDYSYHYDKEFWDRFDVKELANAPEWDGHKPEDIDRLNVLV